MADTLITAWSLVAHAFTEPRVSSAAAAFVVSICIGNYKTAFTCAVIAFCLTRLALAIWGLPIEASSGIGGGIALLGAHGLQQRHGNRGRGRSRRQAD